MPIFHADIEDGGATATVIPDPDGTGFHMKAGDLTVEVSGAQLNAIMLAAQVLLTPPPPPERWAFMGDSNSIIRSGVVLAETYPYRLAALRGITNFAVFATGGHKTTDGIARLAEVLAYAPTKVFINYGVNEAHYASGVTAAQYEANTRTLVAALQAEGIEVVMVAPWMVAESGYIEAQRDNYMPAWRRVARDLRATVESVDTWTARGAIMIHTGSTAFYLLHTSGDPQHANSAGNEWLSGYLHTQLSV